MNIDPGALIAVTVPCVLGIVWMVRLEGRINVTDARFEDIIDRLGRIEQMMDRRRGIKLVEEP